MFIILFTLWILQFALRSTKHSRSSTRDDKASAPFLSFCLDLDSPLGRKCLSGSVSNIDCQGFCILDAADFQSFFHNLSGPCIHSFCSKCISWPVFWWSILLVSQYSDTPTELSAHSSSVWVPCRACPGSCMRCLLSHSVGPLTWIQGKLHQSCHWRSFLWCPDIRFHCNWQWTDLNRVAS